MVIYILVSDNQGYVWVDGKQFGCMDDGSGYSFECELLQTWYACRDGNYTSFTAGNNSRSNLDA